MQVPKLRSRLRLFSKEVARSSLLLSRSTTFQRSFLVPRSCSLVKRNVLITQRAPCRCFSSSNFQSFIRNETRLLKYGTAFALLGMLGLYSYSHVRSSASETLVKTVNQLAAQALVAEKKGEFGVACEKLKQARTLVFQTDGRGMVQGKFSAESKAQLSHLFAEICLKQGRVKEATEIFLVGIQALESTLESLDTALTMEDTVLVKKWMASFYEQLAETLDENHDSLHPIPPTSNEQQLSDKYKVERYFTKALASLFSPAHLVKIHAAYNLQRIIASETRKDFASPNERGESPPVAINLTNGLAIFEAFVVREKENASHSLDKDISIALSRYGTDVCRIMNNFAMFHWKHEEYEKAYEVLQRLLSLLFAMSVCGSVHEANTPFGKDHLSDTFDKLASLQERL